MKTFTIELEDHVAEAIEKYVQDIKAQSAVSQRDDKQSYTVEQAIAARIAVHFKPSRLNQDRINAGFRLA